MNTLKIGQTQQNIMVIRWCKGYTHAQLLVAWALVGQCLGVHVVCWHVWWVRTSGSSLSPSQPCLLGDCYRKRGQECLIFVYIRICKPNFTSDQGSTFRLMGGSTFRLITYSVSAYHVQFKFHYSEGYKSLITMNRRRGFLVSLMILSGIMFSIAWWQTWVMLKPMKEPGGMIDEKLVPTVLLACYISLLDAQRQFQLPSHDAEGKVT